LTSDSLDILFERLLQKLVDWYADPGHAVSYFDRPPVRTGKHGESKPAMPAGHPPEDWRREWHTARSTPGPDTRRRQVLRDMLDDPAFRRRTPSVREGLDFYNRTSYRVEDAQLLISPRLNGKH
jgi:hypothetical protein